jgi:hypothetical protein
MTDLVSATPKPIFKKTHELAKLVRDLKKLSKKAIETLERGLDSEDEKIRMMAAEKLLKYYLDSSKEVNQDELARLLLDVKSSGMIGHGSTAEDDNTPMLNFDDIHPDFKDAEVIDLGDVNKI